MKKVCWGFQQTFFTGDRTRTDTGLLPIDFESIVSTNFTTPADALHTIQERYGENQPINRNFFPWPAVLAVSILVFWFFFHYDTNCLCLATCLPMGAE